MVITLHLYNGVAYIVTEGEFIDVYISCKVWYQRVTGRFGWCPYRLARMVVAIIKFLLLALRAKRSVQNDLMQ